MGITLIQIRQGYTSIDIDTVQVDVPVMYWDDCNYGMVGVSVGGYYNTTMKMCIISLDPPDGISTLLVNFGGGDGGCSGQWNVMQGENFVAFKQPKSDPFNTGIFVYDEVIDLATGNTIRVILNGSNLFDIDNEIVTSRRIFNCNVVEETDGTAFTEVSHLLYVDKTDGTGSHIYQSNIYFAMYDYDSRVDKTILINGVKMNRIGGSYLYVPVE